MSRTVAWTGKSFAVLLGLLLTVASAGCRPKTRVETPEVPVVPVSQPVQRVVTDYVDFTGRTDAIQSANIIARVTGYLVKMPFKEGSEVKAGDLLFEIDPRPYQAQYEQAKSQVDLDEAQLDLAKTTLARYQALSQTTPGAVSEQALDQYKAAVTEAQARVVAQKKSLDVYSLNKEFTSVVSPINGKVSRYYLTLGNLVNQDQTLLTTVVSLDPMYVYFDMDESTWLRILNLIKERKIAPPVDGYLPVMLGLQNEEGYPHKATINFVNNQVNSTTGSITMRGVFPNPPLIPEAEVSGGTEGKGVEGTPTKLRSVPVPSTVGPGKGKAGRADGTRSVPATGRADGTRRVPATGRADGTRSVPATMGPSSAPPSVPRLFSPGMFVRVQLPIGQPHKALLIIDRAIQSDQGLKYVYVLDAQNKAQTRSITTGSLQEDGLRVVEGEIKPDDWVVVGAIQQVRAQMEVKPDQRPMPTLGGPAEAARLEAGGQKEAQNNKASMISRFFIDRPIFATVLSIVITLIGGISLYSCRSHSTRASRRPG